MIYDLWKIYDYLFGYVYLCLIMDPSSLQEDPWRFGGHGFLFFCIFSHREGQILVESETTFIKSKCCSQAHGRGRVDAGLSVVTSYMDVYGWIDIWKMWEISQNHLNRKNRKSLIYHWNRRRWALPQHLPLCLPWLRRKKSLRLALRWEGNLQIHSCDLSG